MKGLTRLIVALVVVVGVVLGLVVFGGRDASQVPAVAAPTSPAVAPAPAVAVPATPATVAPAAALPTAAVPVPGQSDDMVLGNPDAPLAIIEYSSLTCPHCAAFHRDTLPRIKAEWIDTGKAKLIYRDFPFEGVGMGAALLARCVPTERYFGFLETLFGTQQQWAYSKNPLQALQNLALLAGVSTDRFQTCMSDQQLMAGIKAKQAEAQKKYEINSTPSFIVNGTVIVGNQPYDAFAQALEAGR